MSTDMTTDEHDLAIRRWLVLAAASAGVGAALVGWSLAQSEVASADTTKQSSHTAGPASHSRHSASSKSSTASTNSRTTRAVTRDGRNAKVANDIANFMTGAQSVISRLPVDSATKERLGGGLVSVRNTFLNQDPRLAPVQITGQLNGPVTGTLGAVDLEGDKITYTVTNAPKTGTVEITSDGGYTYTPGTGFAGVDTFTVSADDPGLHVNVLNLTDRPGTAADVIINQRAITFEFTYDGPNKDKYWTEQAQTSLGQAADALAAYFVVTKPVTLTFKVKEDEVPKNLAKAGSDLVERKDDGFYPTVVQKKIITGIDANGAKADGEIDINWSTNWAFGDVVQPKTPDDDGQYDFKSTMMHEMLHTFGFDTGIQGAGDNEDGTRPVFDAFVVTADGAKTIGTNYVWNPAYNPNLTGGNGGLYFGGPNAMAAYGGKPVPLLTAAEFNSSSITHLDDKTFSGANHMMMTSGGNEGPDLRMLSPVELGILKDIGYTVMIPRPPSAPAVPG